MKLSFYLCIALTIFLSGCSGWMVEPLPYTPPPTPFFTPTAFPNSPTPIVLPPPITATFSSITGASLTPPQSSETPTLSPSLTLTPTAIPATSTTTDTPIAIIPSAFPPPAQVRTTILSCNTSLDLLHGMGEVTNAYVTVANIGSTEIDNMCATLNGLDEGRPHPDKTKCVSTLPAAYQVTFKLTVDTTYKEATPIQVDVTSASIGLLQRVGKDSCTDVDIIPPDYDGLGTVTPIP